VISPQRQLNSQKYAVSADRQFVLISVNRKEVYRHSGVAKYAVYNVRTNRRSWLSLGDDDGSGEDT